MQDGKPAAERRVECIERGPDECGIIVFLADVRRDQVFPVVVVKLAHQTGGLRIAEVAVITPDPALQGDRVWSVTQHLQVVVEFEQQGIELPEQ